MSDEELNKAIIVNMCKRSKLAEACGWKRTVPFHYLGCTCGKCNADGVVNLPWPVAPKSRKEIDD